MTRKVDLPPEDHVRTVMAGMLADAAAGGPRPTVLALARTLGLTNATFWRHYHDIATELRHHDTQAQQADNSPGQHQRPGQASELARQNAALRRERDHLAGQLEAALSHLRRLAIDNAELRHRHAGHGQQCEEYVPGQQIRPTPLTALSRWSGATMDGS